ncbi:hypothetical protein [Pseudoflavonifractor phocaeensis]|uniref:hypothetical protein n=1 Tax=Pseudoflavonifractor phocaeensis TaxID=1870988 RepID=UPI00210C3A23|nr:hypothetical protein [Pseudoflavonifractor phocaeensis]MCQ4863522.1 hypothetical protein [Pseudoflavonifractor phocaeensis]
MMGIEAIRLYPQTRAELEETKKRLQESYKLEYHKARTTALMSALKEFKPDCSSAEALRRLYDSVAPSLDPDGFRLYRTARHITGVDLYGQFPYEDAKGIFEEMDGHGMLAYLTAACFGTVEAEPIMGTSYERTTHMETNTASPEYQAFCKQLYAETLRALGFHMLMEEQQGQTTTVRTEQAQV